MPSPHPFPPPEEICMEKFVSFCSGSVELDMHETAFLYSCRIQMQTVCCASWVFGSHDTPPCVLTLMHYIHRKDGDTITEQQKTSNTRGSGETVYKKFSVRNFDWMKGYVSNLMVLLYSNPTQNGCCVYFHRYFSSYQLARTNQLKPLIDSYAIIK